MLDVAVPEVRLQRPRIVSFIRKRISTSMPEHVGVRFKGQFHLCPRSFDHAGEPSGAKRRTTL